MNKNKDCTYCINYHQEKVQGATIPICTAKKGEFYGSYVIKNENEICEKYCTPYMKRKKAKKPIYKDDGTGDHYYFCANCDARVPLCSNLIDQIKYKYCPYCGEKIDWSDNNE